MTFLDELRSRAEESTEELARIDGELESLQSRRAEVASSQATWVKALETEQARQGLAPDVGVVTPAKAAVNGQDVNKTELVKDLLRQNRNGIRVRDISKEFKKAGIEVHPNYLYSVVSRLKKQGNAIGKNGKVFPASHGESLPLQ